MPYLASTRLTPLLDSEAISTVHTEQSVKVSPLCRMDAQQWMILTSLLLHGEYIDRILLRMLCDHNKKQSVQTSGSLQYILFSRSIL